ncbi:sulfurtransferase [archaeon]|nr:MAG: sulfurtransferase [archaeon]
MRATMRVKPSYLLLFPYYNTARAAMRPQKCLASEFSSCVNKIPPLLSASQAIDLHKTNPSVKFIDASWALNSKVDWYQQYLKERLPGSCYFDIDKVSDHSTDLPHMLPSEQVFSDFAFNCGISNTDHVLIYGRKDTISAARVWWTFKVFGHDQVSILNGGFESWKAQSGPLESGTPTITAATTPYVAKYQASLVATWQDVLHTVETGRAQIVVSTRCLIVCVYGATHIVFPRHTHCYTKSGVLYPLCFITPLPIAIPIHSHVHLKYTYTYTYHLIDRTLAPPHASKALPPSPVLACPRATSLAR